MEIRIVTADTANVGNKLFLKSYKDHDDKEKVRLTLSRNCRQTILTIDSVSEYFKSSEDFFRYEWPRFLKCVLDPCVTIITIDMREGRFIIKTDID